MHDAIQLLQGVNKSLQTELDTVREQASKTTGMGPATSARSDTSQARRWYDLA